MRTTIDAAGRIVIPKPLREEAGLAAGTEVELAVRDGRIEIEPAPVPMRLVDVEGRATIEAAREMPPLTSAEVRRTLERVRR